MRKNKLNEVSDEELLRRYNELGDVNALNFLFDRYLPVAFAYFAARVSNDDDCADLAQDALLKIVDKIIAGKKINNFYGYFCTSVRNKFRDYLRSKTRVNATRLYENNNDDSSAPQSVELIEHNDILLEIQEERLILMIDQCLENLPDRRSRNILRDYILGYSLKEIADRNKCNPNSAASLWRRRKKELMKCILDKLQK